MEQSNKPGRILLDCQRKTNRLIKGVLVAIGCGSCMACRIRQKNLMSHRVTWEFKHGYNGKFLTLTYSPENLPHVEIIDESTGEVISHETLVKKHLKSYMHRIHKLDRLARQKNPIPGLGKMLYYATGENGEENQRPHYHAIILNIHPDVVPKLETTWAKGIAQVDNIKNGGIDYIISDQIKQYGLKFPEPVQSSFRLISKGLGQSYVDKLGQYHKDHNMNYIPLPKCKKMPLPKYYEKKIFPEKTFNRSTYLLNKIKLQKLSDQSDIEIIRQGYKDAIHYQEEFEARAKRTKKFFKSSRSRNL